MKKLRIGEVLLAENAITEQQLQQALELQKQSGTSKVLGAFLVESGLITEDQMLQAVARHLDIPFVSLSRVHVDIEAVAKIPKSVAMKYRLLAVSQEGGTLIVLINDPINYYYAIEDVKMIAGMPVEIRIARGKELDDAIKYWYTEMDVITAAKAADSTVDAEKASEITSLEDISEDTPVVNLINTILFKAYSNGASDIHFEPFQQQMKVRIRVDGQIVEFLTVSMQLHSSLMARIKIISDLDIAEKRMPQDGHFRAMLSGVELNVRISIMPTIYGEKAVLRFLNNNTRLDRAETFGMAAEDFKAVSDILRSPYGILYVTGPTGSGKTTTLYMMLEEVARRSVNIATIEDPVEKHIENVNQTQTNNAAGLTFERGLRALLRQDPDVIMLGETRDSETASIAVRAAITGHLVLSTLHTNDTVSAIVRLEDMGIEPYMVASSLVGVVAQRLVKKICPYCRKPYKPGPEELQMLGVAQAEALFRGEGCPACSATGYKGRIAIHEILTVDAAVREMITAHRPSQEIMAYLQSNRLITTLRARLTGLVLDGVSTMEELMKVIYFVQ